MSFKKKRKLLFVVNCPAFFLSHRLPIAVAARQEGYDVHVASSAGQAITDIENAGLSHHVIPLSRSSGNPFREACALRALYRLFSTIRPDLVHLVTIKPVLYGGIISRLTRVPAMVAAISGMGTVFVARGFRAMLRRRGVIFLYRRALAHKNSRVIFQNQADGLAFKEAGIVREQNSVWIKGSGVDLGQYVACDEPEGTPVVVFAARLLRDKGVFEFIQAARLLGERGVPARFVLAGEVDPGNPTSMTAGQISQLSGRGPVEVVGYQTNMPAFLAASNIVVLPSYREGLPKGLIEAAACGRAVVTTDVPGCRDAILPNETGLLVPVRDLGALADAIQRLVEDRSLRKRFGEAGRRLAEREYSIDKVVGRHINLYQELLG